MEIAHVLRKFEPGAWGGTESHVAEVCAGLPRRGFSCSILAPEVPGGGAAVGPGGAALERYRTLSPYLGSSASREGLRAVGGNLISLDLPRRLLRRAPALIHVHTGRRIAGAAALAAGLSDTPMLMSVHGPLLADAAVAREETRRRGRGALDLGQPVGWFLGAREVLQHAARVICFNSREQRALEARLGARAVRMDHGVDAARLGSGQARRAAERWPALRRGPAVVVLGRLSEQKNQLLALRAFAEGAPAEAQLLLAGAETDQGYRERVDREAQALGVRGRVWFLGNLDAQEQVPDLLAAATVVLVPSTHEAFGIVVIEAWAAGVPTLFARSSGTEDLATALGVSEATPDDLEVRAWARSLGRLMGEEGLRRRLSEAGRVQVRQRFDRERVLDALAGLYREVLREHEAPGAAEGWS